MVDSRHQDAVPVSGSQLAPPVSLLAAVRVMYAGAVASVLRAVVYVATRDDEKTAIQRRYPQLSRSTLTAVTHVAVAGGVIASLLGAALFIWIARSCRSGRNWARVTALVLAAVGVLAAVYDRFSGLAAVWTVASLVVGLIGLAAVVLLWRARASAWFAYFKRPSYARRAIFTVTVPRADLTTEEVVTVLRDGLGEGYNVLPRMAMGRTALEGPHERRPNTIVVGASGNRIVKAQVTIVPRGEQTVLRISPGGNALAVLLNTFGVARRIRWVLAS
jgi:hypothetical protein